MKGSELVQEYYSLSQNRALASKTAWITGHRHGFVMGVLVGQRHFPAQLPDPNGLAPLVNEMEG